MKNYMAAAQAAWQAWLGELAAQQAGTDREARRRARIRAHSDRELRRWAHQDWAAAELRRRGAELR